MKCSNNIKPPISVKCGPEPKRPPVTFTRMETLIIAEQMAKHGVAYIYRGGQLLTINKKVTDANL